MLRQLCFVSFLAATHDFAFQWETYSQIDNLCQGFLIFFNFPNTFGFIEL